MLFVLLITTCLHSPLGGCALAMIANQGAYPTQRACETELRAIRARPTYNPPDYEVQLQCLPTQPLPPDA